MDSNVVKKDGNDEDRTTDDLISRTQAIVAIEQHKTAVLEGHKWDEGIEYGYAAAHRHIVDIVEQLPSVQPERKKAKWIDGQCSNCGCDIPAYIIDWKWQKDMDANYCPNCGADMRGEQE